MRTALIVLSLIATALLLARTLAAPPAAADEPPLANGMPLLFEEDFEAGHDRWEMTDPRAWRTIEEQGNHVLALERSSRYQPPHRSPHSIASIKGLDVGSFVFEAKLKQTGRDYNHRDLCIFFGRTGPSQFYYVHLATKADDHAHSIFLVDEAPRTSIVEARTEGVKWDNAYHYVRIERDIDSGLIQVFFDDMDTPVMRTHDKTFTTGAIGVGSFDDTGNFDEIRVWAVPVAFREPVP